MGMFCYCLPLSGNKGLVILLGPLPHKAVKGEHSPGQHIRLAIARSKHKIQPEVTGHQTHIAYTACHPVTVGEPHHPRPALATSEPECPSWCTYNDSCPLSTLEQPGQPKLHLASLGGVCRRHSQGCIYVTGFLPCRYFDSNNCVIKKNGSSSSRTLRCVLVGLQSH